MAVAGIALDLLSVLCDQLQEHLPGCADPDMALNNLERFVRAARSPLAMGTLFERDPEALPTLLQILSASQHLSDLLVTDPEGFDLLRLTEGQPVAREMLVDDITAEVSAMEHDQAVLRALRRFKQPRDSADRLRRHHPRAESKNRHQADFFPGRRPFGGGVAGGGAKNGASARHAHGTRRPACPIRRVGHGQAGRAGTELLQRHRFDIAL